MMDSQKRVSFVITCEDELPVHGTQRLMIYVRNSRFRKRHRRIYVRSTRLYPTSSRAQMRPWRRCQRTARSLRTIFRNSTRKYGDFVRRRSARLDSVPAQSKRPSQKPRTISKPMPGELDVPTDESKTGFATSAAS